MTKDESKRAIETDEFFMILPAFHEYYSRTIVGYENVSDQTTGESYVSENGPYLSKEKLAKFLLDNNVFNN